MKVTMRTKSDLSIVENLIIIWPRSSSEKSTRIGKKGDDDPFHMTVAWTKCFPIPKNQIEKDRNNEFHEILNPSLKDFELEDEDVNVRSQSRVKTCLNILVGPENSKTCYGSRWQAPSILIRLTSLSIPQV